MTTLRQLGEREVIRRLSRLLGSRPDVRVGIGDDVAVVEIADSAEDLLLTSDAVIEGKHFKPDADPALIGHKAIGRVLSDLAAAGGEPRWALIDLVAPPDMKIVRLEEVYAGASRLAGKYGLAVVGGDMSGGALLELHVFAVGQLPRGSAVLRSGAASSDLIYVTGSLGGSIHGKHLNFEPRLEEGLWLRRNHWPTAMIDVTDGLATDLRHVMEMSGVGARVHRSRIPISKEAFKSCDARSPFDRALLDGEDFELLFTVPAAKGEPFDMAWKQRFQLPCTRIGEMTDRGGELTLRDDDGREVEFKASGYEHFVQ